MNTVGKELCKEIIKYGQDFSLYETEGDRQCDTNYMVSDAEITSKVAFSANMLSTKDASVQTLIYNTKNEGVGIKPKRNNKDSLDAETLTSFTELKALSKSVAISTDRHDDDRSSKSVNNASVHEKSMHSKPCHCKVDKSYDKLHREKEYWSYIDAVPKEGLTLGTAAFRSAQRENSRTMLVGGCRVSVCKRVKRF